MATEKRKIHFRDQLREFVENEKQCKWDSLNDVQRSRLFTEFYVRKVLSVLMPGAVPGDEEDLQRCITDGSHDHGVDFIYRSEKRTLVIQTKYNKKNAPITKDEFESVRNILSRLYNIAKGNLKCNQRLAEALSDIDWEEDSFEIRFITLGRASDDMRDLCNIGHSPVKGLDGIEDRVGLFLEDETTLNEVLRDALELIDFVREEVSVKLSVCDSAPPWITYENPQGRRCYIGKIQGRQLQCLYQRYRNRLFALNIRHYLGEVATNKKIVETARYASDDFFFYNNGISSVATHVEEDEENGILKCTRFSIINGTQTVNSIFRAFYKDKTRKAAEVEVLIRISQIDYQRDVQEGGFLDCITQYNNTQNAIKLPDFRSNDPVQKDLRRHFADIPALGGRKFLYKNKRESETPRDKIAIGMTDFAKSLHAFLCGPADYYGGTAYLFDPNSGGGYVKVFGEDGKVWGQISRDTFRRLAGIWFVCCTVKKLLPLEREELLKREVEEIHNGTKIEPNIQAALERKHLVYMGVGEVFRRVNGDNANRVLQRLSKPEWMENERGQEHLVLANYMHLACDAICQVYEGESRQTGFTHRDFFRNQKYLNAIKNAISRNRIALNSLAPF